MITTGKSTLIAVKKILSRIRKGGLLLLLVYHGHFGRKEEKDTILTYVQTLSRNDFAVLRYDFLNQKNSLPLLITIEKNKKRNGGWPLVPFTFY